MTTIDSRRTTKTSAAALGAPDRSRGLGHAEAIVLALAIAATLLAAWSVAAPGSIAELRQPNLLPDVAQSGVQRTQANGTRPGVVDVIQPIPGGASSTSISAAPAAPATSAVATGR